MKAGTTLIVPRADRHFDRHGRGSRAAPGSTTIPPGSTYRFGKKADESMVFHEVSGFRPVAPGLGDGPRASNGTDGPAPRGPSGWSREARGGRSRSPARCRSRWRSGGTCTGFARGRWSRRRSWGPAVLGVTVLGASIPGSRLEPYFLWSKETTTYAIAGYGFVASILPVWLLLCPRDYLSSFLKIGTIALLVVGVCVANPTLEAPMVNHQFASGGGPYFDGPIFPMSSSASCAAPSRGSTPWSPRARRPRWSTARATSG